MRISSCHKEDVIKVSLNERIYYYICSECGRTVDFIETSSLKMDLNNNGNASNVKNEYQENID